MSISVSPIGVRREAVALGIDIRAFLPLLEETHERLGGNQQDDNRLNHAHDFETDIGIALHELSAGPQVGIEQTGERHDQHIQAG